MRWHSNKQANYLIMYEFSLARNSIPKGTLKNPIEPITSGRFALETYFKMALQTDGINANSF